MYKYVKNPKTNINVKLNTELGKKIINNYIIFLRGGVSSKDEDEDEFVKVKGNEGVLSVLEVKGNEGEWSEVEVENSKEDYFLVDENLKEDLVGQPLGLENYVGGLKLNKILSKKSRYALIFNTSDEEKIVKCVFISPISGLKFIFRSASLEETTKYSLKKKEFDNECDKFELMNKYQISPKLHKCMIIGVYHFKNLLSDYKQVFGNETNFDKFSEIENLKIGIIVMENLKKYSTLIDNYSMLDYWMGKDQIYCKAVQQHLKKMQDETKHKHCDLHFGNILYNKSDDDVKFIDFSKSEAFESDRDYSESDIWDAEKNCSGIQKRSSIADLHHLLCPKLYSRSKS